MILNNTTRCIAILLLNGSLSLMSMSNDDSFTAISELDTLDKDKTINYHTLYTISSNINTTVPAPETTSASDVQETKLGRKLYIDSSSKINNLKVKRNISTSSLNVLNTATVSNVDTLSATIGNLRLNSPLNVSSLNVTNDITAGGNILVNGSVSGCDFIVDCNILMQESNDSSTGNIFKNGNLFMHNFGDSNTFLGESAGNFNSAPACTGIGWQALMNNTADGAANTAVGTSALTANTEGEVNVAIGTASLQANTIGSANTAVGFLSLENNLSGQENVAVGIQALNSNIDGSSNTALGSGALIQVASGNDNISVGFLAGSNLTLGSNNIYIGNQGLNTESNIIRMGTINTHLQTFIAGISGVTIASGAAVVINGAGQLGTVLSSKRFKENINDIAEDSAKLMQLHPISFNYINDTTKQKQFGFIAEEFAKIYPELVVYDEEGNPLTIQYHLLYALLVDEAQRNHEKVHTLEHTVDALHKKVLLLQKNMEHLVIRLAALEQLQTN